VIAHKPFNLHIVKNLITTKGKDLSFDEQLKISSFSASMFEFNNDKAAFVQTAWSNDIGLVDLIKADNPSEGGICGDIHTASAVILGYMNPDLELYTISYATGWSQHFVSVVADPDDKNKIHIVNYGSIETKENINGVEALSPGTMEDLGHRIRIYKNKGDADIESLATLKNDVGSFLY
jgi:hypothetical protein